jgi:N-carbamoylputrescine amidase
VKVAICELPNGLVVGDRAWIELKLGLARQSVDLLLLNEMPFGAWLAAAETYDPAAAARSVETHEAALAAIRDMPCAVLGSRPVPGPDKLSNEAFLVAHGSYRCVHHKHYFPQEPGFCERTWFAPQRQGFDVVEHAGLRIGVLVCTEVMFTEWARAYRRQGAQLIVVPRASGVSVQQWHVAAAMAAVSSGCYVLSSNRQTGAEPAAQPFGGRGFAFSPAGELIAETSRDCPLVTVDIDVERVRKAQANYPCYVSELDC